MQIRPCFLVVDPEHASSISTRKLVLETAKYNVITAYSCEEAIALIERFPSVNAVVINGTTQDPSASRFLEALRGIPEARLVVVGDGPLTQGTRQPDLRVDSFSPPKLLEGLQRLFPKEEKQLLDRAHDLDRDRI